MNNLSMNLNIKHKGRLTRPWDISHLLIKVYGFFSPSKAEYHKKL